MIKSKFWTSQVVNEGCHVCWNTKTTSSAQRIPEAVLTSSSIRKFQIHSVGCQQMQFFWKGGTCSYFLSFCQQLNSCVPNGLKLSQNIVWQPWKQNLTIIDFQSIHSMNPNIPQSRDIGKTRKRWIQILIS
jgi:hypothetical protein